MKKRILSILSGILFLQACSANYNQLIKDSELAFYQGKYMDAAKMILPYVNKEDKNQLVFMMECGMMLHAAGEFEKSNNILMGAAKLADSIATSISKQTAALLLNETQTNYKGEDFERVLVHLYMGINFLMLKDADSARVAFKRVNELLRDIDVTTEKQYKQNIMAKYLTAIAFELIADIEKDENDREFAYIEYKQIHELDPKLELVYQDLQRLARKMNDMEDYNLWAQKFKTRYKINDESGELILFFHAGRGAVKISRGSLLDDKSMKNSLTVSLNGMPLKAGVTIAGVLIALKIAEHPIPKFQKRSNKIDHLIINVDGRDMGKTVMLEDIENTAVQNLEDHYSKMYTKFAASIATKAVVSVAAGIAAKKLAEQSKQLGPIAGLLGAAVGAGTGAALVSQIKPDLRCWHTLPANLQISRLFLPPGIHNITIKFMEKDGKIERETNATIEIKKGEKSFFNYRTLY